MERITRTERELFQCLTGRFRKYKVDEGDFERYVYDIARSE